MVRYSDEIIDEIRNSNNIVDVVSQYVVLKRSGRNYFGRCPFHNEKSPSFSVSPDRQIFHCFGCGVGGDAIGFISKIEGIGYREAIEVLADRANIKLPTLGYNQDMKKEYLKSQIYKVNEHAAEFYHQNLYLPIAKPAQEYVKKRKLNNATLKAFKIGYSGNFNELYKFLTQKGFKEEEILASGLVNKNENGTFIDRYRKRLMFPIYDVRGRTIGFGGRVLDDSKPKYINSPENLVYSKARNLFGLNVAKKGDIKKILVVEGYMDCVSLHQRGITNVVASLGTALTQEQGRLLRKSSEQVILGYDADGAGQAAIIRGMEILQSLGCDVRILQLSGAKDPDEYVVKYGSANFLKVLNNAISLVEFKIKVLSNNIKIESTSDKIKFLNEIAKILSKVNSDIEKEVYVDKISKEYKISKEAIYAEINKLAYTPKEKVKKILENNVPVVDKETNKVSKQITEEVKRREETIIYLLLNDEKNIAYNKFKEKIKIDDIKSSINKKIIEKIYREQENNNFDINILLGDEQEQDTINQVTKILAHDFEIENLEKGVQDILNIYEKENMQNRKEEILELLKQKNLSESETKELENELNSILLNLIKIK